MKRLQTETLIAAMDSICYVATGEPSGISEVWNGDLDELEEHLEKIEIYAEDEGMTETARLDAGQNFFRFFFAFRLAIRKYHAPKRIFDISSLSDLLFR